MYAVIRPTDGHDLRVSLIIGRLIGSERCSGRLPGVV